MAIVPVATYYRSTIFINWNNFGWSETFLLGESEEQLNEPIALTRELAKHRAWLLPAAAKIVFGRTVKVPGVRESNSAFDDEMPGKAGDLTTPIATDCNRPADALMFRLSAEGGKQRTLWLRGVPDSLIEANTFTIARPVGGWKLGATPAGGGDTNPATYAVALTNFLTFLCFKGYMASKRMNVTIGGVQQPGYFIRPFQTPLFRRVRGHETGRPFGSPRGRVMTH